MTLTVTDSYGLTGTPTTAVVNVAERTMQELEEEAAAKKHDEEEVAAKKHEEEEVAAKKKAEEEAAAKKHEEAVAARKHAEEAATKKKAEEEATATKKQKKKPPPEEGRRRSHGEAVAPTAAARGSVAFTAALPRPSPMPSWPAPRCK